MITTLKIKDGHQAFVFDGERIIGPLTMEEFLDGFAEEETNPTYDVTFVDDPETKVVPTIHSSLPLFDRLAEKQEDTTTGSENQSRISTYGGL